MKCMKCESEMKKVKMSGHPTGMACYISQKEKGLLKAEDRSNVDCYVCHKCGYIELYAEKPSLFE